MGQSEDNPEHLPENKEQLPDGIEEQPDHMEQSLQSTEQPPDSSGQSANNTEVPTNPTESKLAPGMSQKYSFVVAVLTLQIRQAHSTLSPPPALEPLNIHIIFYKILYLL